MKAGIIGCGAIADIHAAALKDNNIEVVGLCDTAALRAENLKNKYNFKAEIFTDYKEMLDKAHLDAVHICTPHYLHMEMTLYALEKNINVILEKPICINEDQLKQIERAVESSSAILGVCFQNRFLEDYAGVKEYVSGKKIYGICASVFWSRDSSYYISSGWRGKKETEGGGVLINQAIHTLDIALWLSDCKASYVTANTSNRHLQNVIDVEDTVECFIETESHSILLYATTAASRNYPIEIKVDLGDEIVEIRGEKAYINGEPFSAGGIDKKVGKDYWGVGHFKFIEKFYSSLSSGSSFPLDIYEGGKAHYALFAIYKSNGERIKI